MIYFGVVLLVSAALEGWIIAHGGLSGPAGWLVLPLMYTPALASIVARLAGREGFGDVSFQWGGGVGTRASLTAWLIPVAIGFVAYGIAWATGLADFKAPADGPLASITNPAARFAASIPIALTVGTVLSCVSAFGEELGWRGYMLPRLHQAEVPAADVGSGVIWCLWHIPLILWGGYAAGPDPVLSVFLFVATVMPVALIYARWRMASGSVWPCVIAHGAWNVIIQSVFDRFSSGPGATVWVGESGVITAATVWVAYFIIRRAPWAGTVPAIGRIL